MEYIRVDLTFALWAAGSMLLLWLLSGLAPAFRMARVALVRGEHPYTERIRQLLVVGGAAVTMILLTCTGLLVRSYVELARVDSGFSTERVHEASFVLPQSNYPNPNFWPVFSWPKVDRAIERVSEVIRQTPGIEDVALSSASLATGTYTTRTTVVGKPEPPAGEQDEANFYSVDHRYFPVLRIPVLRGRNFESTDDRNHPHVAIVNEAFVKRYFGDEDPIGQQILIWRDPRQIVGVVADAHLDGVSTPVHTSMFVPLAQNPMTGLTVIARSSLGAAQTARAIESAVLAADRQLAVYDSAPLSEVLRDATILERYLVLLTGAFGAIALLLAAVGIYSMVCFAVGQQTREIGLRMALGATPSALLRRVLAGAVRRVLIGCVIGLIPAVLLAPRMQELLFRISPRDPAAFAIAAVLLLAVAMVAALIPARRAARLNPANALRTE